jgi:four helix bundle protein
MIRSFEDLEAFQKAYRVSLELHKLSLQLPAIEQKALADQLRRASKSVAANIAEGFAKQSFSVAEFRRYLIMAMASCDEVRLWLMYLSDLGYVPQESLMRHKDTYKEIARMLHGLIKNWKKN